MTVTEERPQSTPPAETVAADTVDPRSPRLRAVAREVRQRSTPRLRSTGHGVGAGVAGGLAVLFVWCVLYALVLTPFAHSRDQDVLYSQFREQVAAATAPLGGAIAPGAPIGVLSVPSAGLRGEVVVEGTSSEQLTSGPGHRRDTVLPGQVGVSVIYGRSTLFGGPFADIARARRGDAITVVTGLGTAKYVIDGVRRDGDPFPALPATNGGRLTLVTSEATGWRSGWAPGRTVFVDATLASKAVGSLPGRPTAVPKNETAMQGDTSVLYSLVLWFPVLILGLLGGLWAQDRWGRVQAWLVGVPIVLAGLWGVTQSAAQLLPNLI